MLQDALAREASTWTELVAHAWMPMATAPKSPVVNGLVQGVYLLCFVPAGPLECPYDDPQVGIRIVWWEPFMGCWWDGDREVEPTFWMPLPLAPAYGG